MVPSLYRRELQLEKLEAAAYLLYTSFPELLPRPDRLPRDELQGCIFRSIKDDMHLFLETNNTTDGGEELCMTSS